MNTKQLREELERLDPEGTSDVVTTRCYAGTVNSASGVEILHLWRNSRGWDERVHEPLPEDAKKVIYVF